MQNVRIMDCRALLERGKSATILIRLMMALNDLSLADDGLHVWSQEPSRLRKERQVGARMYFVRLQFSHLVEGLTIVEDFKADNALMTELSRCAANTQRAFEVLDAFLTDKLRRQTFNEVAEQMRCNLTFHYDEGGKLLSAALKRHVEKFPQRGSTITRGRGGAILWYFALPDELIDNIVVRRFVKVPEGTDEEGKRMKTDDAIVQVQEVQKLFANFAAAALEDMLKFQ